MLKKLSDIEQNLEEILRKKKFDEKYERYLNQLENQNVFLKDGIRRKDKVIIENFSNHVPEQLHYII